jgi:hypothetical protein
VKGQCFEKTILSSSFHRKNLLIEELRGDLYHVADASRDF